MIKIFDLGGCMARLEWGDNPSLNIRVPANFVDIIGVDNLFNLKKELDEMFGNECGCMGAKFIDHIKEHLVVGQDVICKICGKTPAEIFKEEKTNADNTKED